MLSLIQRFDKFRIALFLSSASMSLGILREFLIVWLFGFTFKNDTLQIYLSIFYTIGLTIDAMRLACLNLFSLVSLTRIILSASIVGIIFSTMIGLIMNYSTGGLDPTLLCITILGSYLNLIAALMITFKQRDNLFLSAQVINVIPNFILIPGILICYCVANKNIVFAIIVLTSSIPVIQCLLLFLLPNHSKKITVNQLNLFESIFTFVRHFSAMIGEQLFQMITRAAFFKHGPGYLSLLSLIVRVYSAFRFILIDSYIGSRLSNWKEEVKRSDFYFHKIINNTWFGLFLVIIALLMCSITNVSLILTAMQIGMILVIGFYFLTLVRVIYFKINRDENNASLILRFAFYEILFAGMAYLLTKQMNYPILALLWIGYIVKPFTQMLMLRKNWKQIEEISFQIE